jgi:hypothetical protein
MNRSTILMTCNYSGFTDPRSTVGWAIVDYDWSNAKGTGSADGWAKHKPMDCEEMLVKQVQMAHALSPNTGYFIYRNAIKALNWYTTVRTKLDDPAYASWFLKFNCSGSSPTSSCHVPVCDNNYSPPLCTALYHDQVKLPDIRTAMATARLRHATAARTLAGSTCSTSVRCTSRLTGSP